MSAPNSASSHRELLSRNHTNPKINHGNPVSRDPTTLSTNDIGFNKVLNNNPDVGEETFYQVDIENEGLLRKAQRSELASKRACLTRRWQTALTIGTVLVVLAGAIGGLAYWITIPKVITQPYLLYGASCDMNSRSCDATRMLWCPAGTCICTGNFQWNATAQNCSCGAYQVWTGFKCQSYGSYGDPCSITVPCLPTLTCSAVVNQTYTTGQAICNCDNTTYLDVTGGSPTYGKCIPRVTYNAACQTLTDCQNWLGLSCTSTTFGTRCQCGSTSYWNGSICVQNALGWQPCSGSIPCDTTRGLTCTAGTCECNSLSYWDNVTTPFWCQQKKTYAISCQYSFQCNTTVGLSCPATSTGCNCPTTSISGMCDCQLGSFWDGQRCSTAHVFNGTCPGQYACGSNLVCYLGHCICPGNMIWGVANCSCPGVTVWNSVSNTCI